MYPSDSSNFNSPESPECVELYWCRMTKHRKETIVTRAITLDIGPDGTLSQEDGSWKETGY